MAAASPCTRKCAADFIVHGGAAPARFRARAQSDALNRLVQFGCDCALVSDVFTLYILHQFVLVRR